MKYYYNFIVNDEIVYNFESSEYIKINEDEKIQLEFTSSAPEKKKFFIDYDIENIEEKFHRSFSSIREFNSNFYTINLFLKEKKKEEFNE